MKRVILTQAAPEPVGPYSQAIESDGLLFVSGQIPLDRTGQLAGPDIKTQTRQVLESLAAVLEEAGAGLADVVKTTVYMTDLEQFAEMNAVYARFFGDAPPARATVGVAKLPKGSLVEIECIARLPQR